MYDWTKATHQTQTTQLHQPPDPLGKLWPGHCSICPGNACGATCHLSTRGINSSPSTQHTHFIQSEGHQVAFHCVSFSASDWSKHLFQSYSNPAPSTSPKAKRQPPNRALNTSILDFVCFQFIYPARLQPQICCYKSGSSGVIGMAPGLFWQG